MSAGESKDGFSTFLTSINRNSIFTIRKLGFFKHEHGDDLPIGTKIMLRRHVATDDDVDRLFGHEIMLLQPHEVAALGSEQSTLAEPDDADETFIITYVAYFTADIRQEHSAEYATPFLVIHERQLREYVTFDQLDWVTPGNKRGNPNCNPNGLLDPKIALRL
jgi:hypothetical protein